MAIGPWTQFFFRSPYPLVPSVTNDLATVRVGKTGLTLLGKKGNGKVSKNALHSQNQGFDLQGISFFKISSDQRHYLPNQNVFQLR